MKPYVIINLLKRNLLVLLFFPMLLAGLVYYKTKGEKLEFTSSFLVYTGLASGFNLDTEENHRVDHNAVNNAFDNLLTTIKARETIEEVGIRLLASHLRLDKPDERYISRENLVRLRKMMPDSIESKVKNASSMDEAVVVLYSYEYASGNNSVKDFIGSNFEAYGVGFISSKLVAKRKDFSDMMEISYSAFDPAVCQQTLVIMSEVFLRRYKNLKKGEINNVVNYFDLQTQKSLKDLKKAEEALKQFEIDNKIINFDEETKTISQSKQDLINNIEKEKLVQSSTEATIKNLESKLDLQKGLMETNKKVLEKREKLAELNYKIANSQMYEDKAAELASIKEEAEALKVEIRKIVSDLYKINNSTEGLPRNDLVTQWLNNFLLADESKARVSVLESKLSEFDAMYNRYAPLGSTLNRLKREISVFEKEYLAQLNALNINKQRQQNIDMASTIKVVDSPYFPNQPKASKRMMTVVGSFIAGFVFLFSLFVGREFFDSSVKTISRAQELTTLKVIGALPLVRKKERRFDVQYIESTLMEQAISGIVLEMRHRATSTVTTKFIMISSAKQKEGKTWCSYRLASKFSEIGGKVLLMYPEGDVVHNSKEFILKDPSLEMVNYEVGHDFINKELPQDLLPNNTIEFSKFNYVIIVIPALSENQLPVGLIKKMDLSLIVVRATRKWMETDSNVTAMYRKASNGDPLILLNMVSIDELKEILGDIPKQRMQKVKKGKLISVKNSSEEGSLKV